MGRRRRGDARARAAERLHRQPNLGTNKRLFGGLVMSLIEGTSFSGKFSELTIVNSTAPTSIGAARRRHDPRRLSAAKTTKTLSNVGAALRRYSADLAGIFGTEDI